MTLEYRLECAVSWPTAGMEQIMRLHVCVHSLARSRANSSLRASPHSNTGRSHLKRNINSNRPENDTVLLTTQNDLPTKNNFGFSPLSCVQLAKLQNAVPPHADADRV